MSRIWKKAKINSGPKTKKPRSTNKHIKTLRAKGSNLMRKRANFKRKLGVWKIRLVK